MSLAKKLKEIRDLSPEDILKKKQETSEELMKLKFRMAGGQLEDTAQLRYMRRSIAQMNTVLKEKAAAEAKA